MGNEPINILDLFSGIGGFSKGFIDAGFEIENHYFSEIDLHAIANYKYNFKHSQYVGTVEHVFRAGIERPHVITFGSPCQDFSLAGKRRGLEGDRSSLIEYAITAISHFRPDIFVWENVKGAFSSNNGEDFWAIIQAFTNIGDFRCEWQLLNTSWVLPQNRERIYLVGYSTTSGRDWGRVFPFTENDRAFEKKKISERDGFQTKHCGTIGSKFGYRQTDTYIKCKDTAGTLTGGGNSGGLHSNMTTIECIDLKSLKSTTRGGMFKENESHTLDCQSNLAIGAFRGRNPNNKSDRTTGANLVQTLEINNNGISNTLTSVQKDNVVIQLNNSTESGGQQPYQQNRIYSDAGLCTALSTDSRSPIVAANYLQLDVSGKGHKSQQDRVHFENGQMSTIPTARTETKVNVLTNEMKLRRLTEIECERLQGFPDDWTKWGLYPKGKILQKDFNNLSNEDKIARFEETQIIEIPKTQRYKMLGNAVTKDIVELIATRLKENINI